MNHKSLLQRKSENAVWRKERKAAKAAADRKGLKFDYYVDFLSWAEKNGYNVYAI